MIIKLKFIKIKNKKIINIKTLDMLIKIGCTIVVLIAEFLNLIFLLLLMGELFEIH